MAGSAPRGKGGGTRSEPPEVQGQLEARLRQRRRRLSRGVLAPLAARHGEPPRERGEQGHVVLPRQARRSADVRRLLRQRPSFQGQAPERGKARGRALGAGSRASRNGVLRARNKEKSRRKRA